MKDKLEKLQEGFIDALLLDLGDDDKRTPGLYTVIRGVLSDHRDKMDSVSPEHMEAVKQALKASAPFRLKQAFMEA